MFSCCFIIFWYVRVSDWISCDQWPKKPAVPGGGAVPVRLDVVGDDLAIIRNPLGLYRACEIEVIKRLVLKYLKYLNKAIVFK